MDVSTIVKENTRLQKRTGNNLFDAWTLFQDQAELMWGYWGYKLGVEKSGQAVVDQYWTFVKHQRQGLKKMMNACFGDMAIFLQDTLERPLEGNPSTESK